MPISKGGIPCPCGGDTSVINSRLIDGLIRRRRKCKMCGMRFTTEERFVAIDVRSKPVGTDDIERRIAAEARAFAGRIGQ